MVKGYSFLVYHASSYLSKGQRICNVIASPYSSTCTCTVQRLHNAALIIIQSSGPQIDSEAYNTLVHLSRTC